MPMPQNSKTVVWALMLKSYRKAAFVAKYSTPSGTNTSNTLIMPNPRALEQPQLTCRRQLLVIRRARNVLDERVQMDRLPVLRSPSRSSLHRSSTRSECFTDNSSAKYTHRRSGTPNCNCLLHFLKQLAHFSVFLHSRCWLDS